MPLEPAQPDQKRGGIAPDGKLLGEHLVVDRRGGNRRHQPVGLAQTFPAGVEDRIEQLAGSSSACFSSSRAFFMPACAC